MIPENITTVVIPQNITEIGDNAFKEYQNLEQVTFTHGCHLQKIGNNAFSSCVKLEHISLPESLENIGDSCFFKTPIREIRIPKNVQVIGKRAFLCCGRL